MILIIDYGTGNLFSVMNAFKFWNAEVEISNVPEAIKRASKIVLPGVGSFREAMKSLSQSSLITALQDAVLEDQKPVLGICLGMQLMAESGYEDGWTQGLGWVQGEVVSLNQDQSIKLSVPHVGFNYVESTKNGDVVMKNKNQDFYFCHSYKLISDDEGAIAAKSHYGNPFVSAIQKNNIWGTQFHPEKSQSNGLMLIKRFIDRSG